MINFTKRLAGNRWLPVLVTVILIIYQLIRIIAFIDVYGGVEHDGGWMLSISRSLAERGAYTTLVSTIVDPNVTGAINVDQKFDIQIADGRIWFFTGNGVGPASIVPDAFILKIFGTGFWALRTGPLLFYILFLGVAAYILYRLAGLGAIVLFHAFLFFYPHLSIFLSYEAMGEVPGIFYILWAYLAFAVAMHRATHDRRSRSWLYFLGAGLVAGLAVLAKIITLFSLSGIFIWAGLVWLFSLVKRAKSSSPTQATSTQASPQSAVPNPQSAIRNPQSLVALALGLILPFALWELVHLIILTRLAGFDMYLRQAQQRIAFILDDGSGLGLQIYSGWEFFWDKFFLLAEVTQPQRWVVSIIFAAIFMGGPILLWQWRSQPGKQNLFAPMWFGWLANTIWFVTLAKTGWPRHFWFGLVLAVMLLSVLTAAWLRQGLQSADSLRPGRLSPRCFGRAGQRLSLGAGILLLALLGWSFASQPHVRGFFLPDDIVPYWREKQINNKYHASLPWIIIPRAAQREVVDYIKQMPPEARVYYPAGHKSAEIPPQTGRLHYPLARRNYTIPNQADIVLIGPSIISPWQDPVRQHDLLSAVEQECPRPALKNDFYMICPIEENLAQTR